MDVRRACVLGFRMELNRLVMAIEVRLYQSEDSE